MNHISKFAEFAYVYVAIESDTQLLLKGLHICRIHLHVYRNCICVCCYSNRYAVSLERVTQMQDTSPCLQNLLMFAEPFP